MATVGYIASTIPAKIVRDAGPTLFHVAMLQTGDPLQWVAVAQLNDLIDPWLNNRSNILIPPVLPSGTQTGILTPINPDGMPAPATAQVSTAAVVAAPSVPVVTLPSSPPSPSGTPDLDFSSGVDSMYIIFV
jgi:hypothetical protein